MHFKLQKLLIKAAKFLVFIIVASYLYLAFIRLIMAENIRQNIFFSIPKDALISLALFSGISIFLSEGIHFFLIKKTSLKSHSAIVFLISSFGALALMGTVLGAFILNFQGPGSSTAFDYSRFRELLIILNFQLLLIISYMGVKYLREYHKSEAILEKTRGQKMAYQLKLYKQKLDPHFLFNNLNILSAFIKPENQDAQSYLKKFAEVYQYIVDTQNEELVPLEKELQQVENYLFLIEKRFQNAYQFEFDIPKQQYFIVPSALQLSMENVLKHNKGSSQSPLVTSIFIKDSFLHVLNDKRIKNSLVPSRQTGLENLNNLCQISINQSLKITNNASTFELAIPLIPKTI